MFLEILFAIHFANSDPSSASALVNWMKSACESASDLALLTGIFPWENMIESVWRMMRTACWLHCCIIWLLICL